VEGVRRLDEAFRSRISHGDFPKDQKIHSHGLKTSQAVSIFRAQCISRQLDFTARRMQKQGLGFYTIGSAGHEAMAAVAKALCPTDQAFLHYRDAAFQIMRAMDHPGSTPIRDILLSFSCAKEDPISGGRHKVLGSKDLNIPPQTSTIASHLPKAVGSAFSISMLPPKYLASKTKKNSIVMCSFGDASCNHSSAQGAINSACWTSYRALPMPILFVCEDNGLGISVPTPHGWIKESFSRRSGLKYFPANGLDFYQTYQVSKSAADYVRRHRKPAFLHLSLVRLLGHAGADLESAYLDDDEIAKNESDDPLIHSASLLIQHGVLAAEEIIEIYEKVGTQCERVAAEVAVKPHLKTAKEVMASIVPPMQAVEDNETIEPGTRRKIFGREHNNLTEPQPMSKLINWALTDIMLERDNVVLFGQDVGKKGGVYGVTKRLQKRFGAGRVMDTLLDEQTILGLAIGMSQNGYLPIAEIQFLAYLHNAEDQLRGEAATLSFFSNGQFQNPMIVRIPGLGYQKGFGGHFHNDNSVAVLRDIPGLILVCPSNGRDAALLMRECVRLAAVERRVVVFLEPIALYSVKDLEIQNDLGWASRYPESGQLLNFGEVTVFGDGTEVAIISYGNGFYLSSQAAADLKIHRNLDVRIIDLHWLSPLPLKSLLNAIKGIKKILIVDECRSSGNIAEGLLMGLHGFTEACISTLTAEDSFIATGPAHAATLPSKNAIIRSVMELLER
jgi:2-oxoisovalerate dehydrogenase E1 component